MKTIKQPAIVLVRPQLPENIGLAARAMYNCGLEKLIVVAPREKWPSQKCIDSSAHAKIVIKKAKIYNSISEAVSKHNFVIATSSRKRFLQKPHKIDFLSLFQKVSPFVIGWPETGFYLKAAPLAIIAYIICFGDIITGNEILKEAREEREDDPQKFNINRTNLSLGIRNALSALFAPFFSYQGILATGPHIIIVERWRRGKQEMNSIFDGIGSYTSFGFPWFYFIVPLMTFLISLQGIIFTQFMALTAIGCTQVAMSLVKTSAERGASLFMAVLLISFPLDPGKALLIGTAIVIIMVGWGERYSKVIENEDV